MSFDNIFSFAQITGYIAFFVGIYAYLQKNDQRLKLLSAFECATGVLHFWLMADPAASITLAISFFRSIFSLYTRSIRVALFFIIIICLCGYTFAQSWHALFPVMGSILITAAIFLSSGKTMRYYILAGSFFWLCNALIIGSIGSSLQESLIIIANIITIIRLRLKPRNEIIK